MDNDKAVELLEQTIAKFPNGFWALVVVLGDFFKNNFADIFVAARPEFAYNMTTGYLVHDKRVIKLCTISELHLVKGARFHHIIVTAPLFQSEVDELRTLLRIPA